MKESEAWEIVAEYDYGNLDGKEASEIQKLEEALLLLGKKNRGVMSVELESAVYNLGMFFLDMEIFDHALQLFEIGAKNGSALSMEQAGRIHYFNQVTHASRRRAFEYLKGAEDLGWDTSSYLLADMYREGECCRQNLPLHDEIIQRMGGHSARNESKLPHSAEIMLRVAQLWIRDGEREAAMALLAEAEHICKMRIANHRKKRTPAEYIETMLEIQSLLFPEAQDCEIIDLIDLFFAAHHGIQQDICFFYDGYEYRISMQEGLYEFMEKIYTDPRDLMDRGEINGVKLRSIDNDSKCSMRWEVMTPKKYSDMNFRSVDQQFCLIPISTEQSAHEGDTLLLGYGYIDHDAGLSLQILGTAKKTEDWFVFHDVPTDARRIMRIGEVRDTEIFILENADGELRKQYQERISILQYYNSTEDILETRDCQELDQSRHLEYPDYIKVYLVNYENDAEAACWVTIEGCVEMEDALQFWGVLLNEPEYGFACHKGDMIQFEVFQVGENEEYICCAEIDWE